MDRQNDKDRDIEVYRGVKTEIKRDETDISIQKY